MKTLKDFLDICEEAVFIYKEIAEDFGTSGDIDSFDIYNEDAENLSRFIENVKNEYEVNSCIHGMSLINWLDRLEQKSMIIEGLKIVNQRKKLKIEQLQKEVGFVSNILVSYNISD